MHVELHNDFVDNTTARRGADLISACVHCGFCLATCPTYLDTGDERDSPRGRIYLVKQLLEEGEASEITRHHLDRCLTCRSCETTCPSGMRYGALADLGRGLMEAEAPRSLPSRVFRTALRRVLSRPALFTPLLRVGQLLKPLLPGALGRKVPPRQTTGARPQKQHTRRVLVLEGCAQKAATPATNAAAARVLDRLSISLQAIPGAGCCGAVDYHLGAHQDGLAHMRRNIDAWWPELEKGAEAVISSATGCGSLLQEYGELLAHDKHYAAKAQRISELHRDLAAYLLEQDLETLQPTPTKARIALHIPCSQQHALQQPDTTRAILSRAGFELVVTRDDHLCCGSAGTYSILQADTSERLRQRKLTALCGDTPEIIATANVGCQMHLGEEATVPVQHWIELLDEAISP
ncbi:glycolate oxidase subunit GlcF [Halioglobus maricola]|uniref:Glycolate oxidase iron-sulfur subunit n=1 Tax=Halioglobus maricola TaxID=2601894 RepID=A0A5P9NLL0_9GAMM|nr:glycolate oxidase subunit GlcF [Halioglobus maricola]QFU76386.1 glycolate oxidase subunit GlcF [Halioglobus maricola]